ncbi:MAG TPA: DUF4837 family protein [Rubricoccaceae bacterium]|nr:DUF4837 family protein [Rubricoccaceae bacterium]
MLPRLLPALALGLALGLAACDEPLHPHVPNAVGDPGEVVVVTDSMTWAGPVGEALRATLGRSIAPPLNIADFQLRRRELTSEGFDLLRRQRHVIFAAALDDTSAVARFLEARLDSAGARLVREGRGAFVVPRRDVWATGQIVVLAAAGSDSLLADAFRQHADTLRTLFTGATLARLHEDMFSRQRQTAVEDSLLDAHGFTVNVQHDYFVSQDTTAAPAGLPGHYVRLRRVLSDTWRDLWVYYEDGAAAERLDTAYVEHVTDRLLETFVRGGYDSSFVRIDRARPIRTDSVVLAGRPARETRGLWRMTEDFMGGPFVRYSFYDPAQRRLYVVFGMVYAPQHRFSGNKREFLRQLEVIARTFRTADGPAPT